MIADAVRIRPARPDDADVAAVLLYSAYTHTPVSYPLHEPAPADWIERLREHFRREANRFSYQYCQVAHAGPEVLGLVLSFGGRDEARLNAAVARWLEREADDAEWYIDALAVLQQWSRRGIGTRLLHAAERQGRQHHYPTIALHVAQANHAAMQLYAHQGYAITRHTVLYQRPHVRMEKTLEPVARGNDAMAGEPERSP